MSKEQQVEEIANIMSDTMLKNFGLCYKDFAEVLYNAGYRKETQFIENMKNVIEIEKKYAVKEFAEKVKSLYMQYEEVCPQMFCEDIDLPEV